MKRIFSFFIVLLFVVAGCSAKKMNSNNHEKRVRVALINDASCTDPKSRDAAWGIISTQPGFDARQISAASINLADYDVVIFPGGTGSGQANALGAEGGEALEQFASSGGGVVAICAGGYLAAEGYSEATRMVELANAKLWDLDNWARGEGFVTIEAIEPGNNGTDYSMWFENGPIFVPAERDDLPPYTPLARYVSDMAAEGAPTNMMSGRDAIIAAPFGQGRIVVFGPHPELSPEVNHWLVNAINWSAGFGDAAPGVQGVLEGGG